jgi:hypothetical protein
MSTALRKHAEYWNEKADYPFIAHNGGRTEAKKRYRGDCGVIALAIITGRSYDEVAESLREECALGPTGGTGFERWQHALEWQGRTFHGLKFERVTFLAIEGEPRVDAAEFAKRHPVGRYYVHMRRHAMACVDGVFMGEWAADRVIYKAYKITMEQS